MCMDLGSLSLAATGSMIIKIMITISGLLHKKNMSSRATTSDQPPRMKLENDYGWERWCSSPLNEGHLSPGLPNHWAYSATHCSCSDQEGEFCDKITVSISCLSYSVWHWTGVKMWGAEQPHWLKWAWAGAILLKWSTTGRITVLPLEGRRPVVKSKEMWDRWWWATGRSWRRPDWAWQDNRWQFMRDLFQGDPLLSGTLIPMPVTFHSSIAKDSIEAGVCFSRPLPVSWLMARTTFSTSVCGWGPRRWELDVTGTWMERAGSVTWNQSGRNTKKSCKWPGVCKIGSMVGQSVTGVTDGPKCGEAGCDSPFVHLYTMQSIVYNTDWNIFEGFHLGNIFLEVKHIPE